MAINKRGDRYVVDWWTDGKRYRKFFDRQHDARDFAAKVHDEKRRGAHIAADRIPLFREAAEAWLASRADRAEGTFSQYSVGVRTHLIPQFGERRLDQISSEMITAWRTALAQTAGHSRWHHPLAARTISNTIRTLSAILDAAVRNGRLAANPVKRVERPYVRQLTDKRDDEAVREDEILNSDQIRRLIDAAHPGFERTLIVLAAATGMRSGELFALRWSDIGSDGRPRISIRQSLSWAKGPADAKATAHFGAPKSKAGRRDIPIGALLVRVLKEWRLAAGRNDLDLVFADPDGKPIRRSTVRRNALLPALKRAGLPHVDFHSLRHSFASGLIQRGAPVTEVQHLLGHSNPAITLKVYSHWFEGADSGAANAYSADLFSARAAGVDTK